MVKKLTKQNIEDLLIGSEILGTGGGGSIESARQMIKIVYDKSKDFKLLDPKELSDDKFLAIISELGGGVVNEEKERFAPYLKKVPSDDLTAHLPILMAVKELSKYLEEDFYTYLPAEIGPSNTILPMYVAAMTEKACVDGDACGRAKPELTLSTTFVAGIPVTPMCIVSPVQDVIIVKKAMDDYRAEDIARYLARASGGRISTVRAPARGREYKQAIISNSITKCIELGREIRGARERGKDPIEAFMRAAGNAYRIFEGKVKSWTREEEGAFMLGTIRITGMEQYKGHMLTIWYKNEYMISWKDEKPYVTCPDLICVVDSVTCRGLSNWIGDLNEYIGRKVVVFGLTAANIWRTERGLKAFSPKHFGFDIKYMPVDQIVHQ
jgi:DUF917 family protein